MLAADGIEAGPFERVRDALTQRGAVVELVAPHAGEIRTRNPDGTLPTAHSLLTAKSVVFDAVLVAGGQQSTDLLRTRPDAAEFLRQASRHGKAIGAWGSGRDTLTDVRSGDDAARKDAAAAKGAEAASDGVLVDEEASEQFIERFATAVARHRVWSRDESAPATASPNR